MNKEVKIKAHTISEDSPVYFIAEMSGNHNMDYDRAVAIIDAAKEAGADAVKLQTYTPDTITIDCDSELFQVGKGLWEGRTLYGLYQEAYTPWDWQPKLMEHARDIGIDCFSSPFDLTSVDFLQELNVPAYKIASYEINDIPLIRKVAATGKPVIISTGIAHLEDIELALRTCREEKNENVILLKCVSSYPTPYELFNLKGIPLLREAFDCQVGLSDHSMGSEVAVAAVALGARVVEKHFTLSRAEGGVDSAFSMEPAEFSRMVTEIRNVEAALGKPTLELTEKQEKERGGSRSLFVVSDMKAGEVFTPDNVRSIRPGAGMHTKYYEQILGRKARRDLKKGTPLDWKYIE
ncbi:MAG: pseudaminic acid synthase [Lachnospiraceae bacterium]|nr:pseudaminic acid synthase [Lachnospiraceae bacterium]